MWAEFWPSGLREELAYDIFDCALLNVHASIRAKLLTGILLSEKSLNIDKSIISTKENEAGFSAISEIKALKTFYNILQKRMKHLCA